MWNRAKQQRRIFLTTALAVCLIVATVSDIAVAAPQITQWGPSRRTWDYADGTSEGSLSGPVFNSFTNTPSLGDERNFVGVDKNNSAVWDKSVGVEPGDVVRIRVYVHNNANPGTNGSNFEGIGVARNARVRVYIPADEGNVINVAGYVSADNASPYRVFNTAEITSDQRIAVSYIPGSAVIYNLGPHKGGGRVPDDIVGPNGALLGYDKLDGIFPACFDYHAVVMVSLRVSASPSVLKGDSRLSTKLPNMLQIAIAIICFSLLVASSLMRHKRK